MKYDVSIIMPAIRTPLWDNMYDSITRSCKQKTFELIMCGPFPLTDKLKSKPNVKMIIDNGSPSRCAQRAAIESSGRLIAHLVDDAIFIDDALDKAILFYEAVCTRKDVVNLRYTEGENFGGTTMPSQYWIAHYHPPLRYASIPVNYKQCCHHLVDRDYFLEMGGYDCKFEYQNFNLHDFIFRIQHDGGVVYDSPTDITNCNFYPEKTGDHGPIVEAYVDNDEPYFQKLYSDVNILQKRNKIDINNWKNSPDIWRRRFSDKIPDSYEDILKIDK